jgi:hypothetical protein
LSEPSPAVAARDAEIFAAAEQLRAELGREPLRKELAEHITATTGESCSASRVSQAYRRRKDAEGDTTPGTGGRKKAPLLEDVIDLCQGAIEVAREFDGLPRKEFVGPAGRLRRRKGWEQQLRKLTKPPPAPEQLELELDPLQTVRQELAAIKADLAAAKTDTERRQHRQTLRDFLTLNVRYEPPEQADKIVMAKGDSAEWAREGHGRMKAAAQRIHEDQAEELRAEGLLDKPDARRALRITRWLPKDTMA